MLSGSRRIELHVSVLAWWCWHCRALGWFVSCNGSFAVWWYLQPSIHIHPRHCSGQGGRTSRRKHFAVCWPKPATWPPHAGHCPMWLWLWEPLDTEFPSSAPGVRCCDQWSSYLCSAVPHFALCCNSWDVGWESCRVIGKQSRCFSLEKRRQQCKEHTSTCAGSPLSMWVDS